MAATFALLRMNLNPTLHTQTMPIHLWSGLATFSLLSRIRVQQRMMATQYLVTTSIIFLMRRHQHQMILLDWA
jgi:hypothetical protein